MQQPRLITPETHPNHAVVGKEWAGHDLQYDDWRGARWFCYCWTPEGYWMYNTDGSGHWECISERAIGRAFYEILNIDGRLICTWYRNGVPSYLGKGEPHEFLQSRK